MPITSPFHLRTFEHCKSMRWKDWAGYYAVCAYDYCHSPEYFAFRHAAGLIDVTPLYKYEVKGKDAGLFLSFVMAKDVSKLKTNQVSYVCWCDEQGKIVDDGTVWKFSDDYYRVTAAEASYAWFCKYSQGYDIQITDISSDLAALALQGPTSRAILAQITDIDVKKLGFFKLASGLIDKYPVTITRTGYTGDLGFEVWMGVEHAIPVYDAIFNAGRAFGMLPAGLDAMDVTRVEAGFIMNGVDYFSAQKCLIESRKSTPSEVGLGWTVQMDRSPFVGQGALKLEKERGPKWAFVGLEVDWDEMEKLYWEFGLPPEISTSAWRTGVPLYDDSGKQIGRATSGAWSPLLKKNLALAIVQPQYAAVASEIQFEMTVEYTRRTVTAKVAKTPFYDPARKRSV